MKPVFINNENNINAGYNGIYHHAPKQDCFNPFILNNHRKQMQIKEKFKGGKEIINTGGMIEIIPLIQCNGFNGDCYQKKRREVLQIRKFSDKFIIYKARDQASNNGVII